MTQFGGCDDNSFVFVSTRCSYNTESHQDDHDMRVRVFTWIDLSTTLFQPVHTLVLAFIHLA